MLKHFFVQSEENRNYPKKHGCKFVVAYSAKSQSTRILVTLDEPIPANVYNTKHDLTQLIISPHFEGYEIYPEIKPIPCHVYMVVPEDSGTWEQGPYRIVDWGIIE